MAKPRTLTPEMILLIGNVLYKYGPAAARALKELFQKEDPTMEEFEAIFALAEKPYEDYVRPKPPVGGKEK